MTKKIYETTAYELFANSKIYINTANIKKKNKNIERQIISLSMHKNVGSIVIVIDIHIFYN